MFLPSKRLAIDAVATLELMITSKLFVLNFCSKINSVTHATNEAKNPTIID
jgi:hypothetical protein